MKLFVQNCFTRDIPKMQKEMQTPISILEEKNRGNSETFENHICYLDWNKSPSVNFKCCSLVINYVGLSRQILGQSVVRSGSAQFRQAQTQFSVSHNLEPMSRQGIGPGSLWLAVNHWSIKSIRKKLGEKAPH